jgi:hypothetical protein
MPIPPLRHGSTLQALRDLDALWMTYVPRDLDDLRTSETQRRRGRAALADALSLAAPA